jgi:hypothetical protein
LQLAHLQRRTIFRHGVIVVDGHAVEYPLVRKAEVMHVQQSPCSKARPTGHRQPTTRLAPQLVAAEEWNAMPQLWQSADLISALAQHAQSDAPDV